jgi:hypothetical protein
MKIQTSRLTGHRGFTLIDLIATMGIIATMATIATPQMIDGVDRMRLGMTMRDVERELQFARLKSVSTNRPMRVRFNCPLAGQFRVVELIGTTRVPDAADAPANRCDEATYPYRPTGGDSSRLTRPNNDGPLRRLQLQASFTSFPTLEFWPDGTVHADAGAGTPWPQVAAAGVTITVSRKGKTRSVMVNSLGKVKLQ